MEPFLKRLITLVVSLFLIAYVGYQAFQMYYNPIKVETVYADSVYETVDAEGMVIRNETLITGKQNGYLFYTIDNGSRVSKDGVIARVFPTEADSRTQQKLDQLTASINELKGIQSQGTEARINLDLIDGQIRQTMVDMVNSVHSPVIKNMNSWKSRLLALMNKRQITVGKVSDFTARLQTLSELKNQLASSYSPSTAQVTSPVAGYFVSAADGYESRVSFNNALSLTVADLQSLLSSAPDTVAPNVVGKVVADYKWYFACLVPSTDTGELRQGATPSVVLPFVTEEAIPSTVVAANRSKDGTTALILECSYMSSELSSIRKESVQIRLKQFEGLRVPSRCIITGGDGVQGVYVRVGDMIAFRRVNILYAEPEYVICEDVENDNAKVYLHMYDDLVVEGKGLYDGKIVH